MSLKKILQRVSEAKAEKGTNVLGEGRPLGSLQRSILSTRAFRAQNRQQLLDEAAHSAGSDDDDDEMEYEDGEEMDEKGKPTTKKQSVDRARNRKKRKGKTPSAAKRKAGLKGSRGRSASSRAISAKKGVKTSKRLHASAESPYEVFEYHQMIADMSEAERNEYFEAINEIGLEAYAEHLEDENFMDAKCLESDLDEEGPGGGGDDEDDRMKSGKKAKAKPGQPADKYGYALKKESILTEEEYLEGAAKKAAMDKMFTIAAKMKGPEMEQYRDYLDMLSGKKVKPTGPGAKKAEADYKRLVGAVKEALALTLDPIAEMLAPGDSETTDEGPLDPLGTDKKTKDVAYGQQVVGHDGAPNATGKVKNAKGDTAVYKDGPTSFTRGQDRGQISGYGY